MKRPEIGFLATNTLFALVAVGAASAAFWPTYRTGSFLLLVAVTVPVGAFIALLGAWFRLSTAAVLLATVAAYLLLGVPLAIPSAAIAGVLPSPAGLVQLVAATALSWKQLLTISVPVGSYQALLVPAFLLILLAAVAAVTIAVRARHGEFAVLPVVGLFLAGILLGPGFVASPLPAALVVLVVLLFWLIWIRWQRRASAIRLLVRSSGGGGGLSTVRRFAGARTVFGAAVVIAVAAASGTALTVLLPAGTARSVARTSIAQPFDPRAYPSPLVGFRGYLESAKATQPQLTVRGLGDSGRIRVATMDAYDGVVYGVGGVVDASGSGVFTRVPYRVDQSRTPGSPVRLSVTIDDYRGVWVPGEGELEQIRFAGKRAETLAGSFYYNDATGTAAVPAGLTSGDRYTMDAIVPPVETARELATASPGAALLPKLGVVPDALAATLTRYTASATTPGAKLAAALTGLAAEGYVSHGIGDEPPSRSGHSADRINQLLTETPMLGDQEQYSVTAALMARELGFPARVVFGFVKQETGAAAGRAASAPAGAVTFTGANVSAWIEVQTTDGWVTVDPTPAVRDVPAKQPDAPTQIVRPPTIVQPPDDQSQDQAGNPPQSQAATSEPRTPQALTALLLVLRVVGLSVLILALVLSPFLAVILAKWRRRTLRRGAPNPLARIAGGWQEFADTAVDYGYNAPAGATRSELAQAVGGVRPLTLASVTDSAVFGPGEPTPADADRFWQAVAEMRADLGARQTRRARLAAMVSLRSLGGYPGRRRKR